jgi:hypothetical protein
MGMPGMDMSTMVSAKNPPISSTNSSLIAEIGCSRPKKVRLHCSRFFDPTVLLWPHRHGLLFHHHLGKYTTSLFCEGDRYRRQYYDSKFQEKYHELNLELMTS